MHRKLFIPGPVDVHPDVLKAMTAPMIGHRGAGYSKLHAGLRPKLQRAFHTRGRVFLGTCSSTGVMEAAVRNCAARRVLSCVCGAFSERWFDIARANGKEADALRVEWGKAIRPESVDKALASGRYDAVTLVHNETSTGVMNPLEAIAGVARKHPDVCLLVDAVSSFAGVKIECDRWGLDVCIAGAQKALALPPGLTPFAVSAKALERARSIPNRGLYIDFVEFAAFDAKDQTPTTPVLPLLVALDAQLGRILAEGLDARYARHRAMAELCRAWVRAHGLGLFPEPGFESSTLTAVANTRNIPVAAIAERMKERGYVMDKGYGPIREKTFRIAHMGERTPDELRAFLDALEECLGQV